MHTTGSRGIIDSLSAGFGIVTRRPFLLAIPLLVDSLLLLVPGVSIKPLVRSSASWFTDAIASAPVSPDQLASLNLQVEELARGMEGLNLLGLLGWQVPSLLGLAGGAGRDSLLLTVTGGGQLFLLLAAMAAVASMFASIYLLSTAQLVRQGTFNLSDLARGLVPSWVRLTSYLLLVIAGAVALVVGLLLLVVLLGEWALVPATGVVMGVALLASVYLFLAKPAIFVSDAGPLQAIALSVQVTAQGFWSVLGLFLLVNLIAYGMGALWHVMGTSGTGVLVAIVGNAYICTGLVAAVMVYYWDRASLVQRGPLPAS